MKLQGVFAPLATPFDHRGDFRPAKLRDNIGKWNLSSLAGYLIAGSSGEGPLLTADEKVLVWETAAASAAGRLLIAGASAESTRETVLLVNRAAELGYRAALVRTPSYYRTLMSAPDAQKLHFRAVADQARIPVILYNRPQATGIGLEVETVAELSAHPNIAGMLECPGGPARIALLARQLGPGFPVLAGSAAELWPSLEAGACGAVVSLANPAPYGVIALWEAFRAREEETGQELQQKIRPAARLIENRLGIPGMKCAMDLNGYYGGPPRLPLCLPGAAARQEIEQAFAPLRDWS
ncbi:MAG: dihydrodipicolinate synthase family protein [Acidobacteria bacterium]|nr:dihydrodipicolinate synthase family protein [Acidobacteriota bacterium]